MKQSLVLCQKFPLLYIRIKKLQSEILKNIKFEFSLIPHVVSRSHDQSGESLVLFFQDANVRECNVTHILLARMIIKPFTMNIWITVNSALAICAMM